jgi:hypothetical protein
MHVAHTPHTRRRAQGVPTQAALAAHAGQTQTLGEPPSNNVPVDISATSGGSAALSRNMKLLKVMLLFVLLAAAGVGAGIAYKLGTMKNRGVASEPRLACTAATHAHTCVGDAHTCAGARAWLMLSCAARVLRPRVGGARLRDAVQLQH